MCGYAAGSGGWLAPLGSFSLRNSNDTDAETESSLSGVPSGLAKIGSRCAL